MLWPQLLHSSGPFRESLMTCPIYVKHLGSRKQRSHVAQPSGTAGLH